MTITGTVNQDVYTDAGVKNLDLPAITVACQNTACAEHGIDVLVPANGADVTCGVCRTLICGPYDVPADYTAALAAAGVTL